MFKNSLNLVEVGLSVVYLRQLCSRCCNVSQIGDIILLKMYLCVSRVWPRYTLLIAMMRDLFFRVALNILSI